MGSKNRLANPRRCRRANDRKRRLRRLSGRAGRYLWEHEYTAHLYQCNQPEFPWPNGAHGVASLSGFAGDSGRQRVDRENYRPAGVHELNFGPNHFCTLSFALYPLHIVLRTLSSALCPFGLADNVGKTMWGGQCAEDNVRKTMCGRQCAEDDVERTK